MSVSPKPSGIALCLAGGGFPGALFEFGAIGALEAALNGWRLIDSRIVVGTSCGAVVGAVMALGITSQDVHDALRPGVRHPLSLSRRDFSRFPWRDHARGWSRIVTGIPQLMGERSELSRWERFQGSMRRQLPAGFFSNAGLEDLITRIGERSRKQDDFDGLLVPLAVTATDLDSGGRAVFGAGPGLPAPLSLAVRASAAIPGFFAPVRIGDRDYIDGQIFDPIHIDLAAAPGVDTAIIITPLNPYVRGSEGNTQRRAVDLGATGVLEQSARISAEIKRTTTQKRFAAEHPEIHCLFVEPRPDEVLQLMQAGFTGPSVIAAWRLGFRAAARMLRGETVPLSRSLPAAGIQPDLENLERVEKAWEAEL